MTRDGSAPRPLLHQDAAALIRITALLEGHLLGGEADPHLVDLLVRHLHGAGLVEADASPADLRLALANLNRRIRCSLGEYDAPPPPDTGEVDQYFGFAHRTAELPLSVAFDRHVLRLASLAGEHGGSYGGWGSVID